MLPTRQTGKDFEFCPAGALRVYSFTNATPPGGAQPYPVRYCPEGRAALTRVAPGANRYRTRDFSLTFHELSFC
jgi:hypothetical protein